MTSIQQQVNEILAERREWELRAGFSEPSERDVIRDFSHFREIVDSTLMAIPALAKYQTEIDLKNSEEFIVKSTIAFNLRLYDSLSTKIEGLSLFPSQNNSTDELNLLFLLLWKQSVFSMIATFTLTKDSLYYQAMQTMRGYIESSAVIYLSLIDSEFFGKYSSSDLERDEYMKLWFKELKPSKITQRIHSLHSTWRQIDEAEGVSHLGPRSFPEDIFTAGLVDSIYRETSDFIHFNRTALLSSAFGEKLGHFDIGVKVGSDRKEMDMHVVMSSLFPYVSGLIESLLATNNSVVKYNEMMGDFSWLVKELQRSQVH